MLHHGKYEEIKSNLTNRALARGYFDAEMVRSTIKVYPKEYAADVFIEFSTGHRYRFGEVNIVGVTESQRLDPAAAHLQARRSLYRAKIGHL